MSAGMIRRVAANLKIIGTPSPTVSLRGLDCQAAEKRSLNAKYQMANVKFSIVSGIWH
jgi:hypothetical protein